MCSFIFFDGVFYYNFKDISFPGKISHGSEKKWSVGGKVKREIITYLMSEKFLYCFLSLSQERDSFLGQYILLLHSLTSFFFFKHAKRLS